MLLCISCKKGDEEKFVLPDYETLKVDTIQDNLAAADALHPVDHEWRAQGVVRFDKMEWTSLDTQ